MSVFEKSFWKDTAERTVRGAAQGAVTGWAAGTFTDIGHVASTAQVAGLDALSVGVLTFLTCLVASKGGDPGTASFVSLTPEVGAHEAPVAP